MNEWTMQSRIMSEEEVKTGKKSEWFRFNLCGYVKNFPRNICNLTYITTLVLKNNQLEFLPDEIANLINLVNLDASCNKLQCLPSVMGTMYELKTLLVNDNKLIDIPVEFGQLHKLKVLKLQNNPLSMETLHWYGDGSEHSVRNFIRSLLDTYYEYYGDQIGAPPTREWREIDKPQNNDGMQFTVMCYNILCPKYATTSLYPYCPSVALSSDYRRQGILDEIRMYNADIICIQELETVQYEDVFKVEFESKNYDCIFVPKSRHRTMDSSDSKTVDGCAIFWKNNRFKKVYEFQHEFSLSCTNVSENPAPPLLNRVMTKDNVSLGVIFETKDTNFPSRHLCVTTGHIHWDPEFSDVKLIQTIMWTAELWRYIDTFQRKQGMPSYVDPTYMPVIICGDFNSLPDSGVVDFMCHGNVDRHHEDFREYGAKYAFHEWKTLEKWACDGEKLVHKFNLEKAYKDGEGLKYTNYTYDFKGIIDYVFYSRPHLRLLGSLDMVPETWFQTNKIMGCPHIRHYSDHFLLFVELELVSAKDDHTTNQNSDRSIATNNHSSN